MRLLTRIPSYLRINVDDKHSLRKDGNSKQLRLTPIIEDFNDLRLSTTCKQNRDDFELREHATLEIDVIGQSRKNLINAFADDTHQGFDINSSKHLHN